MLLTLMYHQVTSNIPAFTKHLELLAKNYPIKIPRESLKNNLNKKNYKFKLNLCLTFDDAWADFYFIIFPLLKKLNIKVVLAVPAGLIQEEQDLINLKLSPETRINLKNMTDPGALCTWSELQEMADSGLVQIASHGMTHKSLKDKDTNLDFEIRESKKLLEQKLKIKNIDTFVYPFGHYTPEAQKKIGELYSVSMRVGQGVNFSWGSPKIMHYRVRADLYWRPGKKGQAPVIYPKVSFKYFSKRVLRLVREFVGF